MFGITAAIMKPAGEAFSRGFGVGCALGYIGEIFIAGGLSDYRIDNIDGAASVMAK
ncbi:MAG: hypothetical protein INF74_13795 [Roseomonas sp.]|nr:hypothetical protein [Roseomonas sp.]